MEIRAFEPRDLEQTIALCAAEGWLSYCADPQRTLRAFTAPNVICLVGVEDDRVVGFAQCLTDGAIRAYLANIAVDGSHRGHGIGKRLVEKLLTRCSAVYIDLLSTEGAHGFYRTFPHREFPGYRLHPRSE